MCATRRCPQLIFAVDEEDGEQGEKLCPICKRTYIAEDEDMCEQCRDDRKYMDEPSDDIDIEKDEEWRNYLDDDEKDMPTDGDDVISFSQLADEEKSDDFFRDEEEEEYEDNSIDDEPDDFDVAIDERDFEDIEEEEDEEDDDDDDF